MATDPLFEELMRREVERTTSHDDATIQRALAALAQAVNPVRAVDFDDVPGLYSRAGIPLGPQMIRERREGLGGFRLPNDPLIYINKTSPQYRRAQNPDDRAAAMILAGILAHEQTHSTERGNQGELTAYRIESDFLRQQLGKPALKPSERRALTERLKIVDSAATPTKRP